jgi:hypothetical protein
MFAATSQTTILRAVRKTHSLASTPRARGLDAARARATNPRPRRFDAASDRASIDE